MNNRDYLVKLLKYGMIASLIWSAGYVLIVSLKLYEPNQYNLFMNMFQLIYGIITGFLVMAYSRFTSNRQAVTGASLAILSWALGELYWLSYTFIKGGIHPYPSVGDMGYTGAYFFLISAISMLIRIQPVRIKGRYTFLTYLILLVPIVLHFTSESRIEVRLFNFVLGTAVAYTFRKALFLLTLKKYKWFTVGIFLLGAADVLFMINVSLFLDTFVSITDALYITSISLISFGIVKGDVTHSGYSDISGNNNSSALSD